MGIAGFGRIGEAIARRAEVFGVEIVYHNRRPKDSPYRYYPSLLEMARDVDVLMVVLPGGEATRGVVDADVLRALGPDGILVDVGRGTVVDEPALVDALRSGTIRSAGLDVFADEPHVPQALVEMDHVVLLPHVGSASIPTRDAMGRLCVDNLLAWFTTGVPLTPSRSRASSSPAGARAPSAASTASCSTCPGTVLSPGSRRPSSVVRRRG